MNKIILASGSPRRRELLEQVGIEYIVDPADVDESTDTVDPRELVMELSLKKAKAVSNKHAGEIILAADTVVSIDNIILGKPLDKADAYTMLKRLSGRKHQVYTGVTIIDEKGNEDTFFECSDVEMYEISDEDILAYIDSEEPLDKAGSYGIQGLGAVLVKGINGDYNNIVGLPVSKVYRHLRKIN